MIEHVERIVSASLAVISATVTLGAAAPSLLLLLVLVAATLALGYIASRSFRGRGPSHSK